MVTAKHNEIYPKEAELKAVQKIVQVVESSLKQVSEKIHEEEMMVFTASSLQLVPFICYMCSSELFVKPLVYENPQK